MAVEKVIMHKKIGEATAKEDLIEEMIEVVIIEVISLSENAIHVVQLDTYRDTASKTIEMIEVEKREEGIINN